MKNLLTPTLACALAALLAAACGNKGPLYMEDGESAAKQAQEREDEEDATKREDDK